MIRWEETMEVKILRHQGKSLRQISGEVGMSVNTVRKYLSIEGSPTYKKRSAVITKLSPYESYIADRLQTAHPLKLPATVIFREVQSQGYQGGLTQLRLYIRSLKPLPIPEESIRFETPPGKQMQVDWIEFRKGQNFLAAFVATLGFSRTSYVQFVANERVETLIECHKQAFEYFGGVPREVLYDNMKTVIISRDTYGLGRHRFHAGMLDFARHYGFVLKVCRPYRAQTKGKVERFNRYLRESFYNPLASQYKGQGLLLDVESANMHVAKWLKEVANIRVHQTTGCIPFDRLAQEQLCPLPKPYCGKMKEEDSARKMKTEELPSIFSSCFQHPLRVYQQILEAL